MKGPESSGAVGNGGPMSGAKIISKQIVSVSKKVSE